MPETIISVESLSKRYLVGHRAARRETALRNVIARGARSALRKASDLVHGRPIVQGDEVEEFWALKDATFEVRRGEVLGIIGRNGAGKSTLLKILSRITEPTEGRIRLRGRVASLLEVGTGFHGELSGRENIFLNGAILGMSQADIRRRFDEIVAFAEVERFLDTPVKRYSSGMYVRLAFAIAAHLEPDIMVVDEVLAVGDAEFQKKCLGKMGEVSRQGGRTVLFVSHNMAAVRALCHRGILLNLGRIACAGDVETCVQAYEHSVQHVSAARWTRPKDSPVGELGFTALDARVRGRQPEQLLELTCSFAGAPNHRAAMVTFEVSDRTGTVLMQALPEFHPFLRPTTPRTLRFDIRLPPLVPGEYWVTIWVGPHGETFDCHYCCVSFEIDQSPTQGRPYPHTPDKGFLAPACTYVALTEPVEADH
jgi:lipopolysaccharide transport system ATP-binding protein